MNSPVTAGTDHPETKAVGIWIRVSTEDQAKGRAQSTTKAAHGCTLR